jgi:hypothetical protein
MVRRKNTMKKDKLILDINNLLCKKEVIIGQEEIIKITLFAIKNKLIDIQLWQNNHKNSSVDDGMVEDYQADSIELLFKDITLPNIVIAPAGAIIE